VTARTPIHHAAQVSPDGGAVTFISTASPSGYDNTDQISGKADSEVYLYKAARRDRSASLQPERRSPPGAGSAPEEQCLRNPAIAATLTLPTTMLHAPRYLSADGNRVFFNSFDPLLPRTPTMPRTSICGSALRAKPSAPPSAQSSTSERGGLHQPDLLRGSPQDSEFLDASVNGDDAFFLTNAGLLPQDPGPLRHL